MTNNNDIIILNPDRRRMALINLKGRLKLEIRTGMKAMSKGASTLSYCQQWGYEGPMKGSTAKPKALEWAEQELAKYES